MLTRAIATDTRTSVPLRICTICDGVDSVIRLAAWLSQLPNAAERVDLDLSEALDHLGIELAERFDLLAIAISTERETVSARLVQRLLDTTEPRCSAQVVLVPPGGRLSLREGTRAQVMEGPPFPAFTGLSDLIGGPPVIELRSEEPAAAPLISRFLRLRKFGADPGAATPAGPPLRVLACLPASGGAGASTLAVNLARALAAGQTPLEVCLLDLDLQFGAVASYFDLPPEGRILDAYRKLGTLDAEGFDHCLRSVAKGLTVFTAPEEILPLDAIDRAGLQHLVQLAMRRADLVILDLPPAVADWTEAAFGLSDRILLVSRLDVRSARAIARLRALAGPERMAADRLMPIITHAPRKAPKEWNERLIGFERGLGLKLAALLPDGGESLATACDAGAALDQLEGNSLFGEAVHSLAERLRPMAVPGISARRRA